MVKPYAGSANELSFSCKGIWIMIHKFKNNGYNIVLDVNSGSVHVVDDIAYDAISLYEENPDTVKSEIMKLYKELNENDADELIQDIESLEESGELFSEDIYEDYIDEIADRQTVVKALCLHIAHDCNLSCRYCFAGKGEYNGESALMSLDVGKRALDFLVENSGNRRNLEVDFFGGEPLMNFEVVKDIVAYGRSLEEKYNKKFRFTLTTNGVLLNDDVIEFAGREMSNLVLSIDGRKELHDYMRPFRSGAGSYELILPKFKKAADARHQTDYYARGTFTHFNTDFDKDVLHLADLGFKQISVEPVVAKPTEDYAIKDEDIAAICEAYDRLAAEMLKREKEGNGFNFFHFMIDLTGGPCVAKRLSGIRFGNRVSCGYALGRFVSVPSVCWK